MGDSAFTLMFVTDITLHGIHSSSRAVVKVLATCFLELRTCNNLFNDCRVI